ncbi:MAG: ATP-dependent 6-phosphofructokinase [Ruminococcaceae bacterium]|nr:ATP-dependent 6-phosphofructokinase [Oscillospiraceae bacterium]
MKEFKKIGVLTSGGDAPGMNAAVRAVTRAALAHGVEVVAINRGYSGLIAKDVKELSVRDVSNILNRGGTVLFSDRCPEFKTEEGMQKAIASCRELNINGIIAIGGDGTFRGATDLTVRGIPCIGIPGTIDNDITSTENTIGFDTAMNTTLNMIDCLRDTCESHARCNVVEVMGRNAGDLAAYTALASGATAVVIAELPFDEEKLITKIRTSRALGKRNFIVVVSEGMGTEFAPALTERIEKETGVEARFARFAHVVRGGTPTLRDRMLATRMGEYAVERLLEGKSNIVICEKGGNLTYTDICFALIVDRMYKNTLKEGDLDAFTAEQVEEMKAICAKKKALITSLAASVDKLGL